jgi:hypothetical protein
MNVKRNNGAIIGGSILILVGLLSLLGQLLRGFDFWGAFWPFLVIGCGGLFFVGMLLGGKSLAGLDIPGSIIAVNGLLLLVQNLFGHWESWSYGWTVTIISVGLGIFIMGAYNGNEHTRRSGLRVMEVGIVLLVIFGAFFEMLFSFGNRHGLGQVVFPAALILLGVYLVLARSGLLRKRSQDSLNQAQPPAQEQ